MKGGRYAVQTLRESESDTLRVVRGLRAGVSARGNRNLAGLFRAH